MIREIITSPVTWASGAVTTALGFLGVFDPVVQFIVATKGQWFIIASVGSGVAQHIPQIDEQLAVRVFVVAALVYILIYVVMFLGNVRTFVRRYRS